MTQAIQADALKEALSKMFRNDPVLLENTFRVSRGLARMVVRGAAFFEEYTNALAAIPQQLHEIAVPTLRHIAELQSLPNFPPRISLTPPLARSPVFYSDEAIFRASRDRPREGAPVPVQHAKIVDALRSRRLERGDETRKVLRSVIRDSFPEVTDKNFQLAYSEVYQRKRRGAPCKTINSLRN